MTTAVTIENRKAPPGSLQAVVVRIRQYLCRHKFRLGDQSETGIAPPQKPAANASLKVWQNYFHSLDKHPSHTQRIKWPCAKCGKVFYGNCGLDVLSKHGEIIPHNADFREPAQ